MTELGMGPGARTVAEVFVTLFDSERAGASLQLARELRADGVKVEIGLDPNEKLGKQFKHADRRGIPFALVLGPDDLARGEVVVKNLQSGEQRSVPRELVFAELRGVNQE
jgi:histidyl-tRNA synthetase